MGSTWAGVPMVCLPIWHWYMLRGLWLKSLYGVSEATTLSSADVLRSACVKSRPGVPPAPPSGTLHNRTQLHLLHGLCWHHALLYDIVWDWYSPTSRQKHLRLLLLP